MSSTTIGGSASASAHAANEPPPPIECSMNGLREAIGAHESIVDRLETKMGRVLAIEPEKTPGPGSPEGMPSCSPLRLDILSFETRVQALTDRVSVLLARLEL